ncbi:MAG: DUF559 domain-containing protein [candidate division SR1 bacterium]|nr:DUF559 domain-containing protein [candidate division SR1 bacterium]
MEIDKLVYKPYIAGNTLNAKRMRNNPTPAEDKMWQDFLKHRPGGYKFTRQKPIGPFILDFYCSELFLAVEVDGEIHQSRKEYDQERTAYLVNCGISVARYRNNEIFNDSDCVYYDLLQFIYELEFDIKNKEN